MADRRRDKRFSLSEPAVGALTAFPDVVVQQGGDDEWIGISRQPAVTGEMLVLDACNPTPSRERFGAGFRSA